MSLVVAWIGCDTHGYTSAYIASESRATWPDGSYYDSCRKTFYSKKYPELIGYCGDVQFPTLVIPTILDAVDSNLLFEETDSAEIRFQKFRAKVIEEMKHYPVNQINSIFQIIYVNKEILDHGYPKFHAYRIDWKKDSPTKTTKIELPGHSGIICVLGSGKAEYQALFDSAKNMKNKGTTRNVYHVFSKTLEHIREKTCGGPPQLIGIYRKPKVNGFAFGLIYKRVRYYHGMRFTFNKESNRIEWRNANFEICDGNTRKIKSGSMRQPIDLET